MTRRVEENCNTQILKWLSAKPVAFNPYLGKVSGSANAGLFMSQMLYWWNKGFKDNCIYKTIKEFEGETCLTRGEQDTAIKIWKSLGVLEVELKGIPPIRHFRIDTDKLIALLQKYEPRR